MARNIEIKARVDDPAALQHRVAEIATAGPTRVIQHDTFFACASGRLKLRVFENASGELIFYQRADTAGPAMSFYHRYATDEPDALRKTLELAYGVTGRVRKTRTLYKIGRTRIHLDRVAGLGDFMELEVVLADGEDEQIGQYEANAMMEVLEIPSSQRITAAYIDLITAQSS